MSDKLKIMHAPFCADANPEALDLYGASIGYPDLKAVDDKVPQIHPCTTEQPELDESTFRDYASKSEYRAHVSSQAI